MKRKQNGKQKFYLLFAVVLFIAVCFHTGPLSHDTASASEVSAIGLFTDLSLSLRGKDGSVSADVVNRFTLFPATVEVYVELYRSETKTDDYTKMGLVASNYTSDLNMGQTISASASTEGRPCFWKGRVRYRVDGGAWSERTTETLLADINGNFS